MGILQRYTQKIFASDAANNQVTEFGTAQDNQPNYNPTIAEIQNAMYLQGWTPSLVNDLAPFLEDSNGLWYMITYQLAYLYQEGIGEWDSGTTYGVGSLVKNVTDGYVTIYKSLQDNNVGNPLNNPSYWRIYLADGDQFARYEIGLPQYSLSNNLLNNEVWLDGSVVYKATYINLWNIYGDTYNTGDEASDQFRLPDFDDRVIWGTNTASDFGYVSAGLPNITGYAGRIDGGSGAYGAFYPNGKAGKLENKSGEPDYKVYFDAHRSNGIYRDDITTVQPPAIKVRVKTRYY